MNKIKKFFGALFLGVFVGAAALFVLLFVTNAFMWAHNILLDIEPTTVEWIGIAVIAVIIGALSMVGFMIDDE